MQKVLIHSSCFHHVKGIMACDLFMGESVFYTDCTLDFGRLKKLKSSRKTKRDGPEIHLQELKDHFEQVSLWTLIYTLAHAPPPHSHSKVHFLNMSSWPSLMSVARLHCLNWAEVASFPLGGGSREVDGDEETAFFKSEGRIQIDGHEEWWQVPQLAHLPRRRRRVWNLLLIRQTITVVAILSHPRARRSAAAFNTLSQEGTSRSDLHTEKHSNRTPYAFLLFSAGVVHPWGILCRINFIPNSYFGVTEPLWGGVLSTKRLATQARYRKKKTCIPTSAALLQLFCKHCNWNQ